MTERVRVLITEEEVEARIREVAAEINRDYKGKSVHLICVLKGAAMFLCDLAKRLDVPVSFDFMSVSSYGGGTQSSGVVRIIKDLDEPLEGKDVIIVEDIVDTGTTLHHLMGILQARHPNSMKVCTLLNKPSRREKMITPDYCAFRIPDQFVVGCGLDYDQKYRQLPYIGVVEFDEEDAIGTK